jgi:hypothetical protein
LAAEAAAAEVEERQESSRMEKLLQGLEKIESGDGLGDAVSAVQSRRCGRARAQRGVKPERTMVKTIAWKWI